ncbi:unnamed protein product, partial [Ilex paraguariensis]
IFIISYWVSTSRAPMDGLSQKRDQSHLRTSLILGLPLKMVRMSLCDPSLRLSAFPTSTSRRNNRASRSNSFGHSIEHQQCTDVDYEQRMEADDFNHSSSEIGGNTSHPHVSTNYVGKVNSPLPQTEGGSRRKTLSAHLNVLISSAC